MGISHMQLLHESFRFSIFEDFDLGNLTKHQHNDNETQRTKPNIENQELFLFTLEKTFI